MRAYMLVLLGPLALAGCFDHSAPDDAANAPRAEEIPRVVSAQEALSGAHVPTLDPQTMNDAEISKVLGAGPFCAFRYTSDGNPVLAWKQLAHTDSAPAVVKLNGLLVALGRVSSMAPEFAAGDIDLQLSTEEDAPGEADLIFEVGKELRVGYRGYLVCPTERPPR